MLKTFRIGGIHPNEHKLTAHCPVTPVAVPRQVAIMLNQHIGAPANCIVKKGDTVKLTIEGADEDAAAEAIEAFLKANL